MSGCANRNFQTIGLQTQILEGSGGTYTLYLCIQISSPDCSFTHKGLVKLGHLILQSKKAECFKFSAEILHFEERPHISKELLEKKALFSLEK